MFSLNLGMVMRVDLVLEFGGVEKMVARSGGHPDCMIRMERVKVV